MHRILFLVLTTACANEPTSHDGGTPTTEAAAPASVRNIDVATLAHDLEADPKPVLIDVRTPGEFSQGRVPGAKNIPVDQIAGHVDELKSEGQEIYLICRSGSRSARAASLLASRGVPAVNIEGGTMAWQRAGGPLEH